MKIVIDIDKEEYKALYQAIEELEDENILTDFSIKIIEWGNSSNEKRIGQQKRDN